MHVVHYSSHNAAECHQSFWQEHRLFHADRCHQISSFAPLLQCLCLIRRSQWSESAFHYHMYVRWLNNTERYLGLSSKLSPFSFVWRSLHLFVCCSQWINESFEPPLDACVNENKHRPIAPTAITPLLFGLYNHGIEFDSFQRNEGLECTHPKYDCNQSRSHVDATLHLVCQILFAT